uniref:EGF-like domain-containing protein n=1 Tax=Ciona savignyi TaxID=51511 RepID=H2YV65_CIOSA
MQYVGLALLLSIGVVAAQNCTSGYWGADCMNVCGSCYVQPTMGDLADEFACDPVTGKCAKGCNEGYTGNNCDKAVCKQNCGPGMCVAPNYCANCGDISLVSPNCEDIRLRGLLGSLIAFIVIGISVGLCGAGSVWYKRRKDTTVSL